VPKANPDYAASAVSLCNPPELLTELAILSDLQKALEAKQAELATYKIAGEIANLENLINESNKCIRELIEEQGGYQDIEKGFYALQQRRKSFIYSTDLVKANLTKFASAIIEERVNDKALEGLLKGGLITNEQLASCVGETKETLAFIVRVP
jgi:hypothetical protein